MFSLQTIEQADTVLRAEDSLAPLDPWLRKRQRRDRRIVDTTQEEEIQCHMQQAAVNVG